MEDKMQILASYITRTEHVQVLSVADTTGTSLCEIFTFPVRSA